MQTHFNGPGVLGVQTISLGCVVLTHPCFCSYSNLDDARGRHQKKIWSKTQNYLNLYAVEGLRTLCIAKRVSRRGFAEGAGPATRLGLGAHQRLSPRF